MIDLNEAARRVIEERKHRGWASAHDLLRTAAGILEEGGEFARARRRGTEDEQADALIDLMVYCLGGLRILGRDPEVELLKVLDANEARPARPGH